jgi:hypothetical protein
MLPLSYTTVRTFHRERESEIERLIHIAALRGRWRADTRGRRGRRTLVRPAVLSLRQAVAVPGSPMAFTSRYSSKPSTPFSRPRPDWR